MTSQEGRMASQRIGGRIGWVVLCALLGVPALAGRPAVAQPAATPAAGKALTVERIYGQPSLGGRLLRGLAWSPTRPG